MALVALAALVAVVSSCGDDTPSSAIVPDGAARGDLVAHEQVGKVRAVDVASFVEVEGGEPGATDRFTVSDLTLHRLTYVSTLGDELLTVSGLVMIPTEADGTLDIWQHHHGTIIPGDDGEVPSTYRGGAEGSSEMYLIGATAASNGHVVSMPDYVGYGASADRDHPYAVHDELAASSLDMLRATSQLMAELGLRHSRDVILTGWSEGGGAGLATHKLIETAHADEFRVRASSLLAGPYDFVGFSDALVAAPNEEREVVSLLSWSLYALNATDPRLGRPPSDFWSYDVQSQQDAIDVPELTVRATLTPDALEALATGSDRTLRDVIVANGLVDGWVPTAPVYLHSGTDDKIVLHANSVVANERFTAAGADSTLYEYPGGDHFTPLVDYVIRTLDDIAALP